MATASAMVVDTLVTPRTFFSTTTTSRHASPLPLLHLRASNTPFAPEVLSCCSSGGMRVSHSRGSSFKRCAKFQQFNTDGKLAEGSPAAADEEVQEDEEDVAADQILPQNLETAVIQAGESAGIFINAGGTRAIVEMLVPDFEELNEDGAQQRVWDLARLFLDTLQESLGDQRVKAIFPDAGVAAMVKYQWTDAPFFFGSLNDRRPVADEDEVVVLLTPDHQGLPDVEKIAGILGGDDDTPARAMVMLNPRLISGDVGVGLNVRRMRERLLSKFTTVYSVRPRPEATIFRQYPGLWQVFLEDVKNPGRLILAKEQPSRPTLDDLDMLLLSGGDSESAEKPSALANAVGVFASFNRFMRSLSQ